MNTITIPRILGPESFLAACTRLEELAGSPKGTAEHDEFEALLALAQEYDEQAAPSTRLDPISAVRAAMDAYGLTPKDLVTHFGAPSRVYEFLNGKRSLSLQQIRRLHANLRIPLEDLVGV
jgi:HTH-type transcriptional regulator/antitoxin HigA